MPLYQAILLAIVQGLTEFLPISSTAHLALIPEIFHWHDPGLGFDIALHVGTLVAVFIYFFRDWVTVIANGLGFSYGNSKPDENSGAMLWYLIAATIPVGIAGLLFKGLAEGPWRNPYVIGAMLILIGIVMGIGDRVGQEKRGLKQMTWMDAITVGLAQALAVVPGTSRSGATITAARFRHLDREASARFSFLLIAPAIGAAAAKDAFDLYKHGGIPPGMRLPYVVGIVVSAIVGIIVIAFFLKYLRHNTLSVFVWYRIVFGIIVIALAAFFRIGG
ncbi:MAG TPA: undecaprenyl-diphosphatase UppP [Bryobacteraceae bacterium]|jgi:undecaprenyl-diphosphatase|nr:undecaprenyl-diphosphatase UppP [Bryobacteraceae bacterium]